MSQFTRFGGKGQQITQRSEKGVEFVDYKDVETLRRCMSPNGKIYTRRRIGASARQQRMIAQAIKRSRYMGLLPYTSATV